MFKLPLIIALAMNTIFSYSQCHLLNNQDVMYHVGRPQKTLFNGALVSGVPEVFLSNTMISNICYNVDTLIKELEYSNTRDFSALLTLYYISKQSPGTYLTLYNVLMDTPRTKNGYCKYNEKVVTKWRKYDKKFEIKFWKKWRDKNTKNGKIIQKE